MKRPASLLIRFTSSALRITCLLALTLGLLGPVDVGHAAPVAQEDACPDGSICVNTLLDAKKGNDGLCSLREAIIAANTDKKSGGNDGECRAGSGADTIRLRVSPDPATGIALYALSRTDNGREDAAETGDLDITGGVTIMPDPPIPGQVIIDASDITDRVFHVFSGDVTITGVTIRYGTANGDGGGVHNSANLTLENSTVSGSSATGNGGGIFNDGGTLTLNNSTVSGNNAEHDGGGIYNNNEGALTLNNSTVSGNSSNKSGGGLFNNSGTTNLNNATITDNVADNDGDGAGDGGGIRVDVGTVNVGNSIIAGNEDLSPNVKLNDCSGTLYSLGYNLFKDILGCFFDGTPSGNIIHPNPGLGPLADNGGSTATHDLLPGSPAIDAGDNNTCLPTDQRGFHRPQGPACDMGALEVQDPLQTGPIFTVNSIDDPGDGLCTVNHCTLREAIDAANEIPNQVVLDEIRFEIPPGEPPVIQPTSPLPVIDAPLFIDGTVELIGPIEINGSSAGVGAVGLTIGGENSSVTGVTISNFSSHGILVTTDGSTIQDSWIGPNGGDGVQIASGNNNTIQDNTITANGGAGVRVLSGTGNAISSNSIFDNGQLGIDLGEDGVTLNDPGDGDASPNNLQNSPVIYRATPTETNGEILVEGRLNSTLSTPFTIEFFANDTCDPSNFGEGAQFLGSLPATTTDEHNDIYFAQLFTPDPTVAKGDYITATATDAAGNSSEFSPCVIVGPDNDIWTRAIRLPVLENSPNFVSADYFIDVPGRSRWVKFKVERDSRVIVNLTDLPADFDLYLYNDIQATYDALTDPDQDDVLRLSAEFAPGVPSPGVPSPGVPSPGVPSPGVPSPGVPSLFSYAPGVPSPGVPSPGVPSPGVPSLYDFAPGVPSPGVPSPGVPSPGVPSPGVPSFASAETRSFMAASATDGPVDELIIADTYNNDGDFYVRFMGDNGAISLVQPGHLEVAILTGQCSDVEPITVASSTPVVDGDYRTVILTDLARMDGTDEEKVDLWNALDTFAARPEIGGKVINVGQYQIGIVNEPGDARVIQANDQADKYANCPYAKNLVAQAVKDIVDAYREANLDDTGNETLEYIILVGSDDDIPFFRYPDRTPLGRESAYAPPVGNNTASQASLQKDLILGQDEYGAKSSIAVGATSVPIPDLAVGRLVETPSDVLTMLAAYERTDNGVVALSSALVTGYDFLEDGARGVVDTLTMTGGIGNVDSDLIEEQTTPLTESWSADNLRDKLLVNDYDLIYLAGHFSANSALAADYSTFMVTPELLQPDVVDMTNVIVYSPGCHSGYNIVNEHGLPGFTLEPDWAQAFAQKGATLLAGTGYQYGDTEFLEYSERLYLNFTRELRTGEGPGPVEVPVGQALVRAKQAYLAGTPFLRGIHEKALIEATLFGIPNLSVRMPGEPLPPTSDTSIVTSTVPVPDNPFGLETADIQLNPGQYLDPPRSIDLNNIDTGQGVTATWLQGRDGVVTNPYEPVLPRHVENVSVPGLVLRGVGIRQASYTDSRLRLTDTPPQVPLIGRPTTELAPVLASFSSDIFFPVRPWNVNYFDALNGGGATRLILMPAQLKSDDAIDASDLDSIRRRLNDVTFRFYYLSEQEDDDVDLVDAPTIVNVSSSVSADLMAVDFDVFVVGDPLVGVEDVWVNYTGTQGDLYGSWQSLDLTQTNDSRLWQGTLPLGAGTDPLDVRFFVQGCNGAGLCSMATNRGAYYIPSVDVEPVPAQLTLDEANPTDGTYGTVADFSATLKDGNDQPLTGQSVTFILGPERRHARTDANGKATVSIPLLALPDRDRDEIPDPHLLRANFGGTVEYAASSATESFTIDKQATMIELEVSDGSVRGILKGIIPSNGTEFTFLGEETIFFIVRNANGDIHQQAAIITGFDGRASLGKIDPPRGEYDVFAYYSGQIPRPSEDRTPIVNLVDERYNPSDESVSVVTVGNTPPEAVDDSYTFDGELAIVAPGVLGNDSDIDGDLLNASQVINQPISGTVTLSLDGGFTYTPTDNFSGNDSFTYEVSDGQGDTDIGTVNLVPSVCYAAQALLPGGAPSIWPPNGDFETVTLSVPDGVAIEGISVFQDELVGRKLDAIIDLAASSVQLRAERLGSGDGRVYHIFFTVADGLGDDRTCTLIVGVVPHDLSGDLDVFDGGPLYDSTIPGNIPPQAVDDQYTADEDMLLSVAAADGVLSNDVDWDEDPLSVAAVNGDTGAVGLQVTLPTNALLTMNGSGSFVYDPNGQFEYLAVGETFTDTFTYQASDATDVSTATVSIAITGVNDIPTASDDSGEYYATDEDTPFTTGDVRANDNDPDTSNSLFVESFDATGTVGQVTDSGDGTFDYDPNGQFEYLAAGETVTDTFTYTVSDGNGGTDTATVSITITGLDENIPPVAADDEYSTEEDTPLTVSAPGVLGNDTDPDGDPLTADPATDVSNGALALNPDGSFSYTPNDNFNGTDSFDYQVCDTHDDCDIASVTIEVTSVNDAPTANDDSGVGYVTNEDTAFTTASVLANDVDPDASDILAVDSFDAIGTKGGLVTYNGNGTFNYDPNGQFEGLGAGQTDIDTFTYTVSDGNGNADTASVTITIIGLEENFPPEAVDDSVTTPEDMPVTINVVANDIDVNGNLDPSSTAVVSGPANGSAVTNGNGIFTYTPNLNYYSNSNPSDPEPDSFVYQVCDTDGACDAAAVFITVTPVNDVPDAQDDAYTMNKGEILVVPADGALPDVLDNDVDVEGDGLTITAVNGEPDDVGVEVTLPSGARLTINGEDGSFTFMPRSNFRGEDLFTYTISDGNRSDTATVLIMVLMPNP